MVVGWRGIAAGEKNENWGCGGKNEKKGNGEKEKGEKRLKNALNTAQKRICKG